MNAIVQRLSATHAATGTPPDFRPVAAPPAAPQPPAAHAVPAPAASSRGSVIGDYLRFWVGRSTYRCVDRPRSTWFLPLWGLSLAIAYACSVIVTIVVVAGGAAPPDNAVGEMVEQGSVLGLLLTAVVLAPLIEEVAFRLPMSLRPWHVAGGVAVLSVMFVPGMFGVSLGTEIAGTNQQAAALLVEVALVIAIVLVLGLILRRLLPERSKGTPALISPRVRFGVVVVLTLLFAGAHLSNFSEFTWFLPAFILPQLLVGMVLAYVRVTRSWWMAVGIHALNNAVAIGFGLMPRYATSELAQGLAGLAILSLVALLGLASTIALGVEAYRTWKSRQPAPPRPAGHDVLPHHQPPAWSPAQQPPTWPQPGPGRPWTAPSSTGLQAARSREANTVGD